MDEVTTHREFLNDLYIRNGFLTPELVLEAARPEDSPAHRFVFNVPPDEAAEAYYLGRCHELIRRVRINRIVDEPPQARRVRFWHAVPGTDRAFTYEPVPVLMADAGKLEAARELAVRRLTEAERAVEDFSYIESGAVRLPAGSEALRAVQRAARLLRRRRSQGAGGRT